MQYADDTPCVQQLRKAKQAAHDSQMALLVLCCILFDGSSIAVIMSSCFRRTLGVAASDTAVGPHEATIDVRIKAFIKTCHTLLYQIRIIQASVKQVIRPCMHGDLPDGANSS